MFILNIVKSLEGWVQILVLKQRKEPCTLHNGQKTEQNRYIIWSDRLQMKQIQKKHDKNTKTQRSCMQIWGFFTNKVQCKQDLHQRIDDETIKTTSQTSQSDNEWKNYEDLKIGWKRRKSFEEFWWLTNRDMAWFPRHPCRLKTKGVRKDHQAYSTANIN